MSNEPEKEEARRKLRLEADNESRRLKRKLDRENGGLKISEENLRRREMYKEGETDRQAAALLKKELNRECLSPKSA